MALADLDQTEPKAKLRASVSRFAVIVLIAAATTIAGCVSASKAKADAKAAYLAGQQEGLARAKQGEKLNVTVVGPVRNSIIPWSDGLTLANAIIAAEYVAKTDPKQIFIIRNGLAIPIEPGNLLNGKDVPLSSGDVIQIQP